MFKNKKIYITSSILVLVIIVIFFNLANLSKTQANNSPQACPAGFISVPGNINYNTDDFCVMKYEAKESDGVAVSIPEKTPWVNISQVDAIEASKKSCDNCHLLTENEWLTIAQNVLNVPENWSGGKVGDGYVYSGHNDNIPAKLISADANDYSGYRGTANSSSQVESYKGSIGKTQKRTLKLSNGQTIWDMPGNAAEWTTGQTTGKQPGLVGETSYNWKDWNKVNYNGLLSINPFPGYKNASAVTWGSENGIGQLYSYMGESNTTGFIRGGSYSQGGYSGVLSLYLKNAPSYKSSSVGFRVAK